jgi:hypothetical protein
MRPSTAAVLLAACVGLLSAQWSGVHTHVNAEGFHGAAQGMHNHHHDGHDHDGQGHGDDDHDGDIDVRVVDYGLASKLIFLFLAIGLPLFVLAPVRSAAPLHSVVLQPPRRRMRWRPPLRAPPRALSNA